MVVRKAVTTSHRRATAMRSWLRLSFDTALTISGVRPAATAASVVASASSDSSQSRSSPTDIAASGANASASCRSTTSRVTSSSS